MSLPDVPEWLKSGAVLLLSGMTLGLISGGTWLFYNATTKAEASEQISTAKKELTEAYQKDDEKLEQNFNRQLDILNKNLDRLIKVMEDQYER